MKQVISAALVVTVMYVAGSALAAWLVDPGRTIATGEGLFIGLIPEESLPFAVDSEMLMPKGTVQVGDGVPMEAPSFINIKAPALGGCLFLKIRLVHDVNAIEFIPALGPDRPDVPSQLSLADSNRPACSLTVTVGKTDYPLERGRTLRLVLGADAPAGALFQHKPIASVRGHFSAVVGGFDLVPTGASTAHDIEVASRRIDLTVVTPRSSRAFQIAMDSEWPDRLAIDGQSRRLPWFLARWWRFLKEGKAISEILHKAVSGG